MSQVTAVRRPGVDISRRALVRRRVAGWLASLDVLAWCPALIRVIMMVALAPRHRCNKHIFNNSLLDARPVEMKSRQLRVRELSKLAYFKLGFMMFENSWKNE